MKFSGKLGYVLESVETTPGVWTPGGAEERSARGDLLESSRKVVTGDKINDDFAVSNKISIVADQYFYKNMSNLRYVVMHGVRWKIDDMSIKRPRIILEIGGLWNGEVPSE